MSVLKSYEARGPYPAESAATPAEKIGMSFRRHDTRLTANAGQRPRRIVIDRDMPSRAPRSRWTLEGNTLERRDAGDARVLGVLEEFRHPATGGH